MEGICLLIFDDVVVWISLWFVMYMYIDYDEVNVCGLIKGVCGYIFK